MELKEAIEIGLGIEDRSGLGMSPMPAPGLTFGDLIDACQVMSHYLNGLEDLPPSQPADAGDGERCHICGVVRGPNAKHKDYCWAERGER